MSKKIGIVKSSYRNIRKNLELTYNHLFGNKNYQKFIIITYARTGSNLLMSNLNSHKNIEAKGEVFRDLKGKSCKEVWENFYSKKNRGIINAGFKLFYTHPFHTDDRSVWNFILDDKDIRIIHLVRKNKLRTYLSGEIAKKTDIWTEKGENNISLEEKRVKIDFNDFNERLNSIEEFEKNTRNTYQDHNFIEVSYEELVSHKNKTMRRLFEFLDVSVRETKSGYRKQNNESLQDLILNYDQFVQKLEKSKYSELMELES